MRKFGFANVLFFIAAIAVPVGEVLTMDVPMGDQADLKLKGELVYTLRLRTEDPDPDLATSLVPLAAGDLAFEKNDLVNNKGILKLEATAGYGAFTLFGRGEAFYDQVYDDPDLYDGLYDDMAYTLAIDRDEIREHAAWKAEALEYYAEGRWGNAVIRLGRQVLQWGQSFAPVNAIGVNTISPYDLSKVAAAGYTARDYQVPSLMAWTSYEATETLALEAVYAPDYDARDNFPVTGTFNSYTNDLGYGAANPVLIDNRPDRFEDMQQYGLAVKKVLPALNNLELGFYYARHLYNSPNPVLTMDLANFPNITMAVDYEEIDMYGLSASYCIDALGLQVGGEMAYRPNDMLRKAYIAKDVRESVLISLIASTMNQPPVAVGEQLEDPVGGYDIGKTLNWNVSGMKFMSDIMPFAPWTFNLTPLFEFFGGVNLDYEETEFFYDPERTLFYMVQLPLSVADMIDNTLLTLAAQVTGGLHRENDDTHRLSATLTAKYGDNLAMMVGYDVLTGRYDMHPLSDRDALTFMFTWYFM